MLARMSDIDPRADAPLVDWSESGVSGLLPTGTVTLLLADVEGSTRLWETQPDEMAGQLLNGNTHPAPLGIGCGAQRRRLRIRRIGCEVRADLRNARVHREGRRAGRPAPGPARLIEPIVFG